MVRHLVPVGGLIVFAAIAWLLSNNRRKVAWRTIAWGVALQLLIGLIIFRLPVSHRVLLWLNDAVVALLNASKRGSVFLFGPLAASPGEPGPVGFILNEWQQVLICRRIDDRRSEVPVRNTEMRRHGVAEIDDTTRLCAFTQQILIRLTLRVRAYDTVTVMIHVRSMRATVTTRVDGTVQIVTVFATPVPATEWADRTESITVQID